MPSALQLCGGLTSVAILAVLVWDQFFSLDFVNIFIASLSILFLWMNKGQEDS